MKIYFGKIEDQDLIQEGCFEHAGNHYEYELDINTEEVVIRDICNRIMPFDVESHWEEFVRAVVIADSYLGPFVSTIDKQHRINSDEIRST